MSLIVDVSLFKTVQLSFQPGDVTTGGKDKTVILTPEEMDTILQQTTEASASLEEGQVKQEGKSGDGKQQRAAQEEENLHVVYIKENQSEEVCFYVKFQ